MTTATPSTALATIQPAFTDAERLALAGFLAGYRGLTREAYALDLRQFTTWCRVRSLALFAVRRADIESFTRELQARGRARAPVTRRLSTIAGFFKYAVEEELLGHSPAAHVRRPRVDYESHAAAPGIGKVVTSHTLRHAFITAALDAGVPLRDVQEAASHADPRTTMRYDRARGSLDRHATYIVAAYIAGAAR
jgi:site-specific recombinase XerD